MGLRRNSVFKGDCLEVMSQFPDDFPRDKGRLHPTQKPVALFEYMIRTYTNPGELVLDCCGGSGATAVAAINSGRDYVLIEKDPRYVSVTNHRICERMFFDCEIACTLAA